LLGSDADDKHNDADTDAKIRSLLTPSVSSLFTEIFFEGLTYPRVTPRLDVNKNIN